jgi:hypothetical protein
MSYVPNPVDRLTSARGFVSRAGRVYVRYVTVVRFPPLGWLVILAGPLWTFDGRADEPCPRSGGAWISLNFSGSAWSPEEQENVLRELRVELARRSLDVCLHFNAAMAPAPTATVTLIANDLDRVSIVPSQMQEEGDFSGRTLRVGAVPKDARALAIAQAVDEVLRSERAETAASPPFHPAPEPSPLLPPESTPPTRSPEIASEIPPASSPSPRLRFGLAVGPTVQLAPSSATGAEKSAIAAGGVLRASVSYGQFGGSLGVVLEKSTELTFNSAAIDQFRVPIDASARMRLRAGSLEGTFDLGALLALLREEYEPTGRTYFEVDPGVRAGVTISWRAAIVPWVGASVEILPAPYDLRFAPEGTVGHTSTLWLGFSLGVEARWP